jgi:hypothetical protein
MLRLYIHCLFCYKLFRGYKGDNEQQLDAGTCGRRGVLRIEISFDTAVYNSQALASDIGAFFQVFFSFYKCLLAYIACIVLTVLFFN